MPSPPAWSRDETVLALSVAIARGEYVPYGDPDIVLLSALLRSAAPAIAARCARYRNPHGIARKVWQFVHRIAERPGRALSAGEERVWQEFSSDPRGLAAETVRIRRELAALLGQDDVPSRGPEPAAYWTCSREEGGPAWLYVAVLDGIATPSNEIFVKVGRSNNVPRREGDLNFPLPRRLGLRWRMIAKWELPDAMTAHFAEQNILQSEAASGRSAGGEFLLIATDGVEQLLRRCRRYVTPTMASKARAQRSPRAA